MPTGYFKLTVFILFFSMSSVVNLSVFPIYDRDKKNRVLLTRFIFLYTIAEYWTIWILFNNSIWPTGAYSLMRRKYFCMSTLTSKERCYFEFLSKCEQKKKKKEKKLMVLSPFFFLLLFFFVFCVCNEYLPWQQNKHTNKDLFFQHLHHKRIHTYHNRLEKNLLILRSTKEKKVENVVYAIIYVSNTHRSSRNSTRNTSRTICHVTTDSRSSCRSSNGPTAQSGIYVS